MDIEALRQQAQRGVPEAQLQLAIAYMTGNGLKQDAATGRRWLAEAARNGNTDAARFLGLIYLRGLDTPPDLERSEALLAQAMDAGDREAAWCLASLRLGRRDNDSARTAGRRDLEAAASAGHPRALCQLAWLLDGRTDEPAAPREALELARRAAQAGDGGALLLLSEWARLGRWIARDMPFAGALAQAAAARNWLLAAELAKEMPAGGRLALERLQFSEDRNSDWPAPALTMASWEPRVVLVRRLLSDFECAEVINAAGEHLTPSFIVDQDGDHASDQIRSSTEVRLRDGLRNLVVNAVEERMATWSMVPVAHGEYPLVLRYEHGQSFEQHFDYFIPERFTMGQGPLEFGGQRIATQLLYLNAGFTGGETRFDRAEMVIQPERGMCMMFHNVKPDHNVDPLTRHTGVAVETGVKWLLSRWIRELPSDCPAATHVRDVYRPATA